MIILDIDQDYFFRPIISGNVDDMTAEKVASYKQKQDTGLATITAKFGQRISSNTPILIFRNHDSVGLLLQEKRFTDVILYHLDAHSDIDPELQSANDSIPDMNISNWISVTHQHYSQVYWVLPDDVARTTTKISKEYIPFQTIGLSDVPVPNKIDLITWTLSPEWCPQDVDLFKIFTTLIAPR